MAARGSEFEEKAHSMAAELHRSIGLDALVGVGAGLTAAAVVSGRLRHAIERRCGGASVSASCSGSIDEDLNNQLQKFCFLLINN